MKLVIYSENQKIKVFANYMSDTRKTKKMVWKEHIMNA